jgi:hypothetical protein
MSSAWQREAVLCAYLLVSCDAEISYEEAKKSDGMETIQTSRNEM